MNHSSNKRQYRQLSDMTKQKISNSMKGRSKSDTHREAISKGMKSYWQGVPNRPADTLTSTTSSAMATTHSYQYKDASRNGADSEQVTINNSHAKYDKI